MIGGGVSEGAFRLFWTGQVVSSLGSSFTSFAIPLLVFAETGSAIDLGLATAATYLPYPLLGLPIGALADRLDRKRLMIAADVVRASTIGLVALAATLGPISIWLVAGCAFVASTASIAFDSGATAAIACIVDRDDLVRANGRLQAGDAAAQVVGPLLAGVVVALAPLEIALAGDAVSFLVSALSLVLIAAGFGGGADRGVRTNILTEIADGLRFTLGDPILRELAALAAIFNLVGRTIAAQLVLFAVVQYHASPTQIAALFSAASAGTIAFALAAPAMRRRLSFSTATIGAVIAIGVMILLLARSHSYPAALLLVAVSAGLIGFFNVLTTTLRQTIAPPELLGRVTSVARVLSWSAIPLGALAGGWLIEQTGDVAMVYSLIGGMIVVVGVLFRFTALGRADRHLSEAAVGSA
jgi:MFS family permease